MTVAEGIPQEQRRIVRGWMERFLDYTRTEEFRRDLRDRHERTEFFQNDLPGRLEDLSEADVLEIVSMLWAFQMWGNKNHVAQKITKENGLEHLRECLKALYEMAEEPEAAYEQFLNSAKHWGPASVTEMLAYIYPHRCGIWNKQARTALETLGLTGIVNLKKYRLSKEEYRKFNHLMEILAQELRQLEIEDTDLLVVDFFLYYVAQEGLQPGEETKPTASDFDHDEVRDLILAIGSNLGFDAESEVRIAHGAQVDVVWRARIGNLGEVNYVFEVHRSGSVDSLLLNLQKANSAPGVQRVVAISDTVQLEQIRHECDGLPDEFRRALLFWDVGDVMSTAEALREVMDSIHKLGLLETKKA